MKTVRQAIPKYVFFKRILHIDKGRGRLYTTGVKKAVLHLFVISGSVIVWGGAIILLLRGFGYQQSHQAIDHPLISDNFYLIAKGAGEGEAPSNSYLALKNITDLNPHIIAEIDLWLTKDRRWVIYGDGLFQTVEGEGGKIHEFRLEDLQKKKLLFGQHAYNRELSLLTLDRVLFLFPKTTFLLDIHHHEEEALVKLPELINRFQAGQRVLVHSLFPQVLRLLREREPRWLYFPDQPQVMQAKIMSSIFLEPLIGLQSDFVFQNLTDWQSQLPRRMHVEALRREQKVIAIIDRWEHWTRYHQQTSLKLHGVMTSRPNQFVSYLHK